MRVFYCVAKALAKHGLKFAAKMAGVDHFYEFGLDVYQELREAHQEDAIRNQVEEVAPLSQDEARHKAEQAVAAVAPQASSEQKRDMVQYLSQIPAQIRQSMRRVGDPSGKTVPATQRFAAVEDLLPLLPTKLPIFKEGDRPLQGVDLQLVELLGRGGFGEVWKARNPYLSSAEPVVLKFTTDDSAIKILRNEAGVLDRVMRKGKHSGIVPLRNTYLSSIYPCLEYEYVEGFDLSQLIRQWHETGQADWQKILPWFVQLVEILAFMHEANPPIVHCDLKPANIFVHRQNGTQRLRVLDFGIGGLAASQALVDTGRPANSQHELLTKAARGAYTPLYASPQQKMRPRDEPPDPSDDVHALGIIWYQMLTGDLEMTSCPSDWKDELADYEVPGGLVELLGQCIASKQERRPANATSLLRELKNTRATKPTEVPDTSAAPPPIPTEYQKNNIAKSEVPPKATTLFSWFASFFKGDPDRDSQTQRRRSIKVDDEPSSPRGGGKLPPIERQILGYLMESNELKNMDEIKAFMRSIGNNTKSFYVASNSLVTKGYAITAKSKGKKAWQITNLGRNLLKR